MPCSGGRADQTDWPRIAQLPFRPGVRADLFKLDRFDEARAEFERAAALTRNTRERELLLERARACKAV
jgi:predicted RNA polymerase sigma factor